MEDLDEIDRAFVASLTPNGSIATGFLAIVQLIDEEGQNTWKVYLQMSDMPVSTTIGLLEMAKLETLKRCEENDA